MSLIVCKIPKAGLGNQLFPLMKAVVKQQLTGLPLIVTNYRQFAIGPHLRREKSKRRYIGYFNFEKNMLTAWVDSLKLRFYKGYQVVKDPSLNQDITIESENFLCLYAEPPRWDDYFFELKDYRDIVLKSFYRMLKPRIVQMVNSRPVPCIGVHIRMGDFRKLKAGENFAAFGSVRTPEEYFIKIITAIRKIAGKELPVTVFTDGYQHEFDGLFTLPSITMMEGNPDIVDLILLSKSKVIVTSATSTFSYWAGFFSDAVLIMHPDHLHAPIRSKEFNKKTFEGPLIVSTPDELLVKNIRDIIF